MDPRTWMQYAMQSIIPNLVSSRCPRCAKPSRIRKKSVTANSSVPYPVAFGHCFALAFDASHSPLLLVKDLARRCGVANGKGCNSAKALKGAPPFSQSQSNQTKPPLSEYFINLLCGCQSSSSPVSLFSSSSWCPSMDPVPGWWLG